jgi:hypothetical protein
MRTIKSQLNWEQWSLVNRNKVYSRKIYVAKNIRGVQKNVLYLQKNPSPTHPDLDFIPRLAVTTNLKEADYVLVPHPWVALRENSKYIKYLVEISKRTPILILNTGDISPSCFLPNTLELRTFLHPWENRFRKIVLPWPIIKREFNLRAWRPKPTISFMGHIPKLSPGSLFGQNLSSLRRPIKSSVFINRKISVLKLNSLSNYFDVSVVERDTFTALRSNLNFPQLSSEFSKSLSGSDYVLCPRGFGNSTVRFYEVISSGATPILVDSGSELPRISENNFWDTNVLKVKLFENWRIKLEKDWATLSPTGVYEKRQEKSRQFFSSELEFEQYVSLLFQDYLIG